MRETGQIFVGGKARQLGRVILSLLLIFVVCGLAQAGDVNEQKDKKTGRNVWTGGVYSPETMQKNIDKMLSRMQANGLISAIDSVASGQEALDLKAIVIHETNGGMAPNMPRPGASATGPFQILWSNLNGKWNNIQAQLGYGHISTPDFAYNYLMKDPVIAAKAGQIMYRAAMRGHSRKEGFCVYSLGRAAAQCAMPSEIDVIVTLIQHGKIDQTQKTDPQQSDFSEVTTTPSSTGEAITRFPCTSPQGNYAQAIALAQTKYRMAVMTAVRDSFEQSWTQENKSPLTNTHGDLMKTKCFKLVLSDYFDKIRKFLSGDWIEALLQSLIESILNQACQFIASAINSLLNSVCLPIPSLPSLGFSIPSMSGTSCSGVSLGSFISAQPVTVTLSGLTGSNASKKELIPRREAPQTEPDDGAPVGVSSLVRGIDPKTGLPIF